MDEEEQAWAWLVILALGFVVERGDECFTCSSGRNHEIADMIVVGPRPLKVVENGLLIRSGGELEEREWSEGIGIVPLSIAGFDKFFEISIAINVEVRGLPVALKFRFAASEKIREFRRWNF